MFRFNVTTCPSGFKPLKTAVIAGNEAVSFALELTVGKHQLSTLVVIEQIRNVNAGKLTLKGLLDRAHIANCRYNTGTHPGDIVSA